MEEVEWMRALLTETKYRVVRPCVIYSDNQAAINITHNDIDHDRTKHIDIKYYYIRDMIKDGKVNIQ